jgi:hypothetical protein
MNVLHWSDVPLPSSARNANDIYNTPKGDVEIYYKGLVFLYRTAEETNLAFKTHQSVM